MPSQKLKKRGNTSSEIQGKEEQLTHSTASGTVTNHTVHTRMETVDTERQGDNCLKILLCKMRVGVVNTSIIVSTD